MAATLDKGLQRTLEYAGSAALVACLGYFGFFYTPEADYMTLVGAAESQAEGAQRVPPDARNRDGQKIRDQLLDRAMSFLNRAEASAPSLAQTCEVRAFITALRGEHLAAAELYAKARTLKECDHEMRDELVLNQVRAVIAGQHPDLGLALLDAESAGLMPKNKAVTRRLRARALQQSERVSEAHDLAIEIQAADAKGGLDSLFAGKLLEELGDQAAAGAAYVKATTSLPVANYFLARLKVRNGEPDRGVEMLERAISAARRETVGLLRRDSVLWNRYVGAERLSRLIEPSGKAATPGR